MNEGRGTDHPFSQFGAPWINVDELYPALQAVLQHVQLEPVHYVPSSGVYADETCYGVKLKITDLPNFKAVSTGITILQTMFRLYPEMIQERFYTTHANPSGERHMDKLLGYENAFEKLKNQEWPLIDIAEDWSRTMKSHLLYS